MANRPAVENEKATRDIRNEQFHDWASLWRRQERSSVVHVEAAALFDGSGQDAETRRQSIQDSLAAEGAPDEDRAVIDRILSEPTGVGGPCSRFVVVTDGEPVVNEVLAGPMASAEIVSHTKVPNLLPLLVDRGNDALYLVVEAGRDGGEIHAFRARHSAALRSEDVQGRTDSLNKVQAGGWAHSRYQHHSEEIWKQNQNQLADAVDALVRELRPRLIVLAGDLRAVQLLVEELAPASREIASTVATHVRAAGSSRGALNDHVASKLDELRAKDETAAIDRLSAGDFENGAVGVGAVIHSLQQGQVETILLDLDALGDRPLFALASEPWVASAPEEALGAKVLESVPAALALARAGLVADSRLLFVESGRLPERAGVAAVLRWPTGPAVPGTARWTPRP
ncbi:Vms1/Ankzf1 family peptidyl-tRNA hydrolase [Mycetocola sp. 2940]|uniref:baeRF2 domain-containing protein n=1 Tax=Mycetocola sp. 2940 TaxID=3156452 RepID=UPI003390BAFA